MSIYRFAAMRNKTPSLTSTGPHSLNSPVAKALFYVFHSTPELLATIVMFSVNAREVFGTGLWGDLRARDPKPKPQTEAIGADARS